MKSPSLSSPVYSRWLLLSLLNFKTLYISKISDFFLLYHVLSPGCGLHFAFNAGLFGFVFIFYGFVGVRNEVRIIFYFLSK